MSAEYCFNTEHQFFHREGLGDVVVGAELEAFQYVFLQRLGCKENDRHVGVGLSDFLCQCESVFLRHHHVEHADVELGLHECFVASVAVGAQFCHVTFGLQILAKKHTQVFVILAQQNFQFIFHSVVLLVVFIIICFYYVVSLFVSAGRLRGRQRRV